MCPHLRTLASPRAHAVEPGTRGCKECLESGSRWVHLRLCMTCGHVGCCDSSANKHASRHFTETGHPVVKSFEPDEDWAWCYADGEMAERIPAFAAESPSRHYGSPSGHV